MSDPRFKEFLEDKVEHYSFAGKLMDFCLERSTKPSWEEFIKKSQFPILLQSGPFKQCQVIFRDRYARCWIEKEKNELMDNAVKLLYRIFGEKAEITPQKDDKAIGVMIRDEESCDNLMEWLSGIPSSKSDFLSAKDLFKIVRKENILEAIKDFENGIEHEFGPSTQYDLIHEGTPYPPKAILGIACKYVEGGRLLKPEDFSGGEESTCFRTLRREGFTIEPKKERRDNSIPSILKRILELQNNYSTSTSSQEMIERDNLVKIELVEKLKLNTSSLIDNLGFKIEASTRAGLWAHIPWVRISDPEHSPNAQQGYYLVLLFSLDGKRLYLSLNQGTTYTKGNSFIRKDLNEIEFNKQKALDALTKEGFNFEHKDSVSTIDLKDSNGTRKLSPTGSSYSNGHIHGNVYHKDNLPTEREFISDIKSLFLAQKNIYDSLQQVDNLNRKFWLYAPGEQARLWRDCWERKEIILLWDEIPDLRNFSTKDEIKNAFIENDSENTNPTNDILALWEFASSMSPGDVIIAKQGRSTYLGYGIVTGDYIFNDQVKEGYHVRKVDWKKHGEWDDPLGTFALKTLTHITNLETSSPDYDTYVDRLIDLIGIELDGNTKTLKDTKNTMINYSFIKDFHSACEMAGLQYPRKLLQRFTASLLAKRFLILTGLSGSGKTKLAQAFSEWIGGKTINADPFYPGAGIESSQKTYHVAKSDSISVEFWNNENEENSTKVTLAREMIKEWAECIIEHNLTKETSPRTIRDLINETSQFSPQLHSFETHLKASAFTLIESKENKISYKSSEIIPVGADWTSNENILGYPDGLNPGIYNSTPVLDLVLKAESNSHLPHFLILDEMNLSHVERYFADMLSAIESDEPIPLYETREDDPTTWRKTNTGKIIPPSVKLPVNLFVIGTVNVDETTYMFSPKVLDRANVIEFRVESDDIENFLQDGCQKPDLSELASEGSQYAEDFVEAQKGEISIDKKFATEIKKFFKIFSNHDSEFGFRVANEAARLINFQKNLGSESFNENFDSVIVQKFLPKLHGSRSQMEELLQELILVTSGSESEEWSEELLAVEKPRYSVSYKKLCRMYKKLQRDQFVSFAEA